MSKETLRVRIQASQSQNWSLTVVDADTGKLLPVLLGSVQINVTENMSDPITATATLIISELDLKEVQLNPKVIIKD